MALQKDYTLILTYTNDRVEIDPQLKNIFPSVQSTIQQEIIIPNAYIQITEIRGSKEKLNMLVTIYKDNSKSYVVDRKPYSFVPSVENDAPEWLKQGYNVLKATPEFEDAIDVLEEGQAA